MHRLFNGIRGLLNSFQPKRNSILGLDIASTGVHMVELSVNQGISCVETYGREPLLPCALSGTSDAVATSIKTLFNRLQPSSRQVVVAVPDASVISKTIQVNACLSDAEVEELVYIEADKYIPYPVDEISFDFEILGRSESNPSLLDVLFVASRTENVTKRLESVAQAGLDALIVDVESHAVERVVQQFAKDLPVSTCDKTVLIIDLESSSMRLFVLHQMKLVSSHEEQYRGMQVENQLLESFTDNILFQIKRALQFFYSTSQDYDVAHILLAGSFARLPGLINLLQEHTGITTTVANPFTYMLAGDAVDLDAMHYDAPALLIACGLALRRVD